MLLGAPTAGGKTEAVLFPLLSRMLEESWSGLSVLYVCPLRALLNNLEPRVDQLCRLLGRRAALWHGDVGDTQRRAILRDPPDVLLTTPESLEAMAISTRVDQRQLLGGVRSVVADEVHAFAGDDRGWHLLAVMARLDATLAEPLQRIGLTATVGNPDALLDWLVADDGESARSAVIVASGEDAPGLELEVDWVATTENAAQVVHALHRGQKRLVFADSRARVEELATALRALGTTVFVSHSSLAPQERRDAEAAFSEARNCVIVATSTLELGIDVGDLDRVIQLGAPASVASLLQRVGRTGRRPGTARNCLFLATRDSELLQALALVRLARNGWVEPLVPPPKPVHLVAQQALARVLSEGRIGRSDWPGALERVLSAGGIGPALAVEVLDYMVAEGVLVDEGGVVAIGPEGERQFGRRNFMDVLSLFLSEPLLGVRWGRRELGSVDPGVVVPREPGQRAVLLLGGRPWAVRQVDWEQRLAWVEPSDDPGRSRWAGEGRALSREICEAQRAVLVGADDPDGVTQRARSRLGELRDEIGEVPADGTWLLHDARANRTWWWTFAGARANRHLAAGLSTSGHRVGAVDDLRLAVDPGWRATAPTPGELVAAPPPLVDDRRVAAIKFAGAVPREHLAAMIDARDADAQAIEAVAKAPVRRATIAS